MSIPAYDGSSAATSVLMSIDARNNPVLFVEGSCEVLLFAHHYPQYKDRIIPCGGHAGVKEAIKVIEQWEKLKNKTLTVLGLIDRDYGSNSRYRRMTVTNNRDIEVDLYLTQAGVRLLSEKSSSTKCTDPKATILEAITSLRIIGLVRKYNAENCCGWIINSIRIDRCLDREGNIDHSKFFNHLKTINTIIEDDFRDLEEYIKRCEDTRIMSIIRGHDISILLGKWLKNKIGNRKGPETTMEVLEENLRLSSRWSELARYHWARRAQIHLANK